MVSYRGRWVALRVIIEGRSGWRLEVGAGGGLFDVRGWLGCVDAPGVGVIPEVDKCK